MCYIIDEGFINYYMTFHKIKGNKLVFRVKLKDSTNYGKSNYVKKFLVKECIFYLRNKYPELCGKKLVIQIDRDYNGRYYVYTRTNNLLL